MVKGKPITMLSVTGGLTKCMVALDRKLSTLMLARSGKKDARTRAVPLESVEKIWFGEDAASDVELPLDDLCVALLLENSSLCFRLEDLEERDTFALCLTMFVDGRKAEVALRAEGGRTASRERHVIRV
mmetsp:Transcript_56209/g.147270  ORF Transcript_56209/g.147270 Transcript_56209/m.147270 type:complete len:129 (-) Transcript_56209:20-406(-)